MPTWLRRLWFIPTATLIVVAGVAVWIYTRLTPSAPEWLNSLFVVLEGLAVLVAGLGGLAELTGFSLRELVVGRRVEDTPTAPPAQPLVEVRVVPQTERPPIVTPLQAPAEVPNWVGREAEVERLLNLFRRTAAAGEAQVAAITGETRTLAGLVGMGGIGKTALAIHIARCLHDDYPDGVLWLELRQRPEGAPADLMRLLADVAAQFGQADMVERIQELPQRAAFVRSLLADKRVLMVLDDVVDNRQLELLLPGSPCCAVLVTSRLTNLPALLGSESARLDRFTHQEAEALFRSALQGRKPERLDAGPKALADVIDLCGGLPLALAVAAGWLAANPNRSLSPLRSLLEDRQHRLNILKHADKEVRAAFELSYDDLTDDLKRCFRCLAVLASPTFGVTHGMNAALCEFEPNGKIVIPKALFPTAQHSYFTIDLPVPVAAEQTVRVSLIQKDAVESAGFSILPGAPKRCIVPLGNLKPNVPADFQIEPANGAAIVQMDCFCVC